MQLGFSNCVADPSPFNSYVPYNLARLVFFVDHYAVVVQ